MTCERCGAACQGRLCAACEFEDSREGDIYEDAPHDPERAEAHEAES